MPVLGIHNAEAQQIGSTDHLTVGNKNFAGSWCDQSGGTSFMGTAYIPLTQELINTAPEIFSVSSNILTILEAGIFVFYFTMSAKKPGSQTGQTIWYGNLEEDPATGVFAAVPATQIYGLFTAGQGAIGSHAIIDVKANYRYRLAVAVAAAGEQPVLVAQGSKLSAIRLYKNG